MVYDVLPPEPEPSPVTPSPAVTGGGGIRRSEAGPGLEHVPPPEFWDMVEALDAVCVLCGSSEPHLHGSKLFQAGKELF